MSLDDRRIEGLSALLPTTFLIGLMLQPSAEVLAAADLSIQVTPGRAILAGHVAQLKGDNDLKVNSATLAASKEQWFSVVAYWNPAVAKAFLLVVEGTAADTGEAVKPTDEEIEAAIVAIVGSGAEYAYTLCGAVLFETDGGSVPSIAEIDHEVRSYGVPTATKPSSNDETDVVGGDAEVYRPWGRIHLGSFDAEDIADGDLVTSLPVPPIYGRLRLLGTTCTEAVTTAAKATSLNMEIGTTNVTGTLAKSGAETLGAVETQALSGSNTFKPGDTMSLEAASTTAYVEGAFDIWVEVDELVTG